MVGEEELTIVGLSTIEVITEVPLATTKLLMGEAAGEAMSKATREVAGEPTIGDLLPGRPIDYLTQCLLVGSHLSLS